MEVVEEEVLVVEEEVLVEFHRERLKLRTVCIHINVVILI